MHTEEYVDIYDEDRTKTGLTLPRKDLFLKEGQFQLYVTAIIEDIQGRYLITQRAMDKAWGAGWWEVPGGGVPEGETTEQAVVREVAEEVGLDVSTLEAELIHSYKNVDLERGHNYFMDIFRFKLDFTKEDVVLQEGETIDCALVTWEEIEALNEQGIFLHFGRIAAALGK